MLETKVQVYRRIKTLAPDEASIMLLIPIALFSDAGGGIEVCKELENRPAVNAAQDFYAGLLEKHLKSKLGEERGRIVFPRVSQAEKQKETLFSF